MRLSDSREEAAKYYDFAPHHADHVPFYPARIPSAESRVLELGCGTGSVSLPLLAQCADLHGVDHSASMRNLLVARVPAELESRLRVTRVDISGFDLDESFDFVIAPCRVVKNLETDAQLTGLLGCIRKDLRPGGFVASSPRSVRTGIGIVKTGKIRPHLRRASRRSEIRRMSVSPTSRIPAWPSRCPA